MDLENTWKTIPDYPGYEVNGNGVVKNRHGRILNHRYGKVTLTHDRKSRLVKIARVIYSAFHQVEMAKLKKFIFVGESLDKLKVYNQEDFLEKMRKNAYISSDSSKDVDKYYAETKQDIELIIKAQTTGCMDEVVDRIESLKEKVAAYIYEKQYSKSKDSIEEAWGCVREQCLAYIANKTYAVVNIYSMLKTLSRFYFIKMRKEKRRCLEYRDEYSSSYIWDR